MQVIDISVLAKLLRYSVCGTVTVLALTTSLPGTAAELLEHISEDSTPPPTADQVPVDDRRITYRVICTPDGEQLPDCEQPLQDRESAPPASSPESAESTSVAAEEAAVQPVSTQRRSAKKTGSGKKAKASSKAKRKKTRK
ncbi:hypothetical protein [Methylomonas rhizoryzae]|uniref:hypothetical protein n=1 Tax=Methylomonas rhizoryzae TaxID=2608981 RepID=UPI001232589C|nr:hypothetical protein [Methylomonas rhizoryzae]